MYEIKNGAKRIVNVLNQYTEDEYTIKRLAAILNYRAPQLAEDIQALADYIQDLENNQQDGAKK